MSLLFLYTFITVYHHNINTKLAKHFKYELFVIQDHQTVNFLRHLIEKKYTIDCQIR
jgi:hypothetical protein